MYERNQMTFNHFLLTFLVTLILTLSSIGYFCDAKTESTEKTTTVVEDTPTTNSSSSPYTSPPSSKELNRFSFILDCGTMKSHEEDIINECPDSIYIFLHQQEKILNIQSIGHSKSGLLLLETSSSDVFMSLILDQDDGNNEQYDEDLLLSNRFPGMTIIPNHSFFQEHHVNISDSGNRRLMPQDDQVTQGQEESPHKDTPTPSDTVNSDSQTSHSVSLESFQWQHQAVGSKAAWEQGVRGQGVTVAIIDSGIDTSHPDLLPNIDTENRQGISKSFVLGEEWYGRGPGSFHGTHVAGIVGATDDGYGVTGIAPDVTLVGLKVMSDQTGQGEIAYMLEALIYAADTEEIDIVNMSLSIILTADESFNLRRTRRMQRSLARTVCKVLFVFLFPLRQCRTRKGTTVILSMPAEEFEPNNPNRVFARSDCDEGIFVSASGPIGWAFDALSTEGSSQLYIPAMYSYASHNSDEIDQASSGLVDFAGPGGTYDLFLDPELRRLRCTVFDQEEKCFRFDLVLSTFPNGDFEWLGGTSMAAPAVAGVAALILSESLDDGSSESSTSSKSSKSSKSRKGKRAKKMKPSQLQDELIKRALVFNGPGEINEIARFGHVHSGYFQ